MQEEPRNLESWLDLMLPKVTASRFPNGYGRDMNAARGGSRSLMITAMGETHDKGQWFQPQGAD